MQDLILICGIENGYLVRSTNEERRATTDVYCADEAAVAEHAFRTLSTLKSNVGRMTVQELDELTKKDTEPSVTGEQEDE